MLNAGIMPKYNRKIFVQSVLPLTTSTDMLKSLQLIHPIIYLIKHIRESLPQFPECNSFSKKMIGNFDFDYTSDLNLCTIHVIIWATLKYYCWFSCQKILSYLIKRHALFQSWFLVSWPYWPPMYMPVYKLTELVSLSTMISCQASSSNRRPDPPMRSTFSPSPPPISIAK